MANNLKHTLLLNGCYVSAFTVFPRNWNKPGADPKLEWRIHYRFYDPAFVSHPNKGVKQCKVMGMNKYYTLDDKREATRALLNTEKEVIIGRGYNPITKTYMKTEEEEEYIIHPLCGFITAITQAAKRLTVANSTRTDINSVIKGVKAAATVLRLQDKPIKEIRRRNIIKILDQCAADLDKWSVNRHNKYRAYLLMLFGELVEVEAVEYNIIREIKKKKGTIKNKREILTVDERRIIDEHLRATNYRFWLYMQIFYHSGCRETELMSLTRKNVDLENQKFSVLIKKGIEYRWVDKTIRNVALPLWEQAVQGAQPNDHIFSAGLKPGPKQIRADQVTKRWHLHVKKRLGINKDFYSLKHLNTDDTDAAIMDQVKQGLKIAAAQNSHKNEKITENHYAVGHGQRMHEVLKEIGQAF